MTEALAFAHRQQFRFVPRHLRRQLADVRREAHRGGELLVERRGIDDPGELAHMLLPGRELERSARRIAFDVHVVDRRGGVGGQAPPTRAGSPAARPKPG